LFLEGVLKHSIHDVHWSQQTTQNNFCLFNPTHVVTVEHSAEDLHLLLGKLNHTLVSALLALTHNGTDLRENVSSNVTAAAAADGGANAADAGAIADPGTRQRRRRVAASVHRASGERETVSSVPSRGSDASAPAVALAAALHAAASQEQGTAVALATRTAAVRRLLLPQRHGASGTTVDAGKQRHQVRVYGSDRAHERRAAEHAHSHSAHGSAPVFSRENATAAIVFYRWDMFTFGYDTGERNASCVPLTN
jgi:hypothetical protein